MESVRSLGFIDLVASIWAANSDQYVILFRQISGYLALALAAILSSDKYINNFVASAPVESQSACGSN